MRSRGERKEEKQRRKKRGLKKGLEERKRSRYEKCPETGKRRKQRERR